MFKFWKILIYKVLNNGGKHLLVVGKEDNLILSSALKYEINHSINNNYLEFSF